MRTSAFALSGTRVAMVIPTCVLGIVSMAWAFGQDAISQVNAATDPQQNTAAPLTLTLQDALARARKINPEYHAALTELGIAKEDRVQSRAARGCRGAALSGHQPEARAWRRGGAFRRGQSANPSPNATARAAGS